MGKDEKMNDELEEVEKAETKEEKKRLIEDAGMELTDEELDQVAGGAGYPWYFYPGMNN